MNREPDPQSSAPRRVEAYLDTVLTSLPRRLSASERDGLRRELREHLWSRVEAYKELGQTEGDAVTEALQQFGGGKDFVKQWKHDWNKPAKRITAREVWKAAVPALALSAITLILSFMPLVFSYYQYHFYGANCWLNKNYILFGYMLWPFLSFVLPMSFGGVAAKYVPKNAVVGVFAALCLEAILGQLIQTAVKMVVPETTISHSPEAGFFGGSINPITYLTVLWMPVACGAAALTGWWTRRARARRVA